MPTTLTTAVAKYLRAHRPAHGTTNGCRTTLKNWSDWGGGVSIEKLGRKKVRSFLDWVYDEVMHCPARHEVRMPALARLVHVVYLRAKHENSITFLTHPPGRSHATKFAARRRAIYARWQFVSLIRLV
jgi:hypothetical protein